MTVRTIGVQLGRETLINQFVDCHRVCNQIDTAMTLLLTMLHVNQSIICAIID